MLKPPIVIDKDTQLRPMEERHARALFALVDEGRAYLREWQNWPDRIRTVNDMRTLIQRSRHKRRRKQGYDAVILYRGRPVGKIGYVFIDWKERRTEIGYWLGQQYQGKGLMTRACRVLVDYALTEMGLDSVRIRCAAPNERSAAIPRRLGFLYQPQISNDVWIHGRIYEELVFVMTQARWQNRFLYHITPRAAWEAAQAIGRYEAESLAMQGFIHLARRGQVERVANAVYTGQSDLVLLCIDPTLAALDIRDEPPDPTIPATHYDGEMFPHLYGALPLRAVVSVMDFTPKADGTFSLPSEAYGD